MDICENHSKTKDIFCSRKECLQTICSKCIKDHFHNGQNFLLSIDDIIEEFQKKHQSSISKITNFKDLLDDKLKENTNILANFDEKTLVFAEKVEKQLQMLIDHISKCLKEKKNQREKSKKLLGDWVMESGKAVGTLKRNIEELSEEMNKSEEAISAKNYIFLYERNLEVKADIIQNYKLLIEQKLGIEDFENVEKGAKQFLIDEFISFSQLDQYKSQMINEADNELQEKLTKITQTKIEYQNLDELFLKLKKEFNDEKRKFDEQQQEFLRNPSIYLKNFDNSIKEYFEKNQKMLVEKFEENKIGIKNGTRFLSQQLHEQSVITCGFNNVFSGVNVSQDGLVCSNENNETRYCLCSQKFPSDSDLKINLLFIPGGCPCANFGLIEDFDYDPSSNKTGMQAIKFKECFYIKRNGEISKNLKGIIQEIGKKTQFSIIIKKRQLSIYSIDGLIKLEGSLTKDFYYLGVSPCCKGNSFQILKFQDNTSIMIEKQIDDIFL